MKLKKMRVVALILVFISLFASIPAGASSPHHSKEAIEIAGNENSSQVQVFISISFSDKEAEEYKKSIADTLELAKESLAEELALEKDKDKQKYFLEEIEKINEFNFEELFEKTDTNSLVINLPHRNGEVEIEGVTYDTDFEGYIIPSTGLSKKGKMIIDNNSDIELYTEGHEMMNANEDIQVDFENQDLKLTKTFSEFAEGIQMMSDHVEDVEGQAIKYYPKAKVGTSLGNGAGSSKVFFDTNIVGCNKHDKDTKSINTAQFALQNSDCSRSVKLGVAYLASPLLLGSYKNSANCVYEAVANVEGKGNKYCNGKKKSGKVNCSWFSGIGHSESFHTH